MKPTTIGERIRDLRKKRDLTQEKLADFLGVSYQAVSKWECNLTSPDLGLIGPLTKLLGVTADELLGLTEEENDERRAYFDNEYKGYWKRNDFAANYEIAKQAVEEYPGDFKYLNWLANMEYYLAFEDEDYRQGVIPFEQLTHFQESINTSIRHSLTVYENAKEEELRNSALWGVILCYRVLNRPDEARHYAELYPEQDSTTRDDAMLLVLRGEERKKLKQKMLIDVMNRLDVVLDYFYEDGSLVDETDRVKETILHTLIPDGNYLGFAFKLFYLRIGQAKRAARAGDRNAALRLLKEAAGFGLEYDRAVQDGTMCFTAPLLNGYISSDPEYREGNFTCAGILRDEMGSEKAFDLIRSVPEFQALLAGTNA
ncbi:MAG: helix-turn-helix domain-containing protein [Clostridia bacterium]|nr:helix-turn-helix domain-containing protein [Clostridia bacterium]